MSPTPMPRRTFLGAALASGAALALARRAHAKDTLVVATFPGTWNEVHREILAPYFRQKTNAEVTQTILLATDQISKLQASRGVPPFDVAILDEGPLLDGVKLGLFEKYPVAKSKNFADLLPPFKNEWGPCISMQAIGLAYNPKKIKTPPRSWDDLWNPAYKGRVGLTALNSSLGMAFMVELARLKGGSESNLEPAFRALKTLLPNVGAISANLGAHAALIQQEQVDIAVHNFNFIETLRGKGVDVDWVKPDTGAPAWRTSMHIVKGAQKPDLAFEYIDGHIDPGVQSAMEKAPNFVIPTNRKVSLTGAIVEKIARTPAELGSLVFHDWAKINEGRAAAMERFNREIKL
jgi:putative spermidine/putrescine transport system substrate-binding protein